MMITTSRVILRSLLIALSATFGSLAHGQEMEPRAFSPAPVGSQFVLITYGHQSGDVLLDSSLPLRDVEVKFNVGSIAYRVMAGAQEIREMMMIILKAGAE